ncbi:1522_t:CDS:2, partial [Funneliformis caledonium]
KYQKTVSKTYGKNHEPDISSDEAEDIITILKTSKLNKHKNHKSNSFYYKIKSQDKNVDNIKVVSEHNIVKKKPRKNEAFNLTGSNNDSIYRHKFIQFITNYQFISFTNIVLQIVNDLYSSTLEITLQQYESLDHDYLFTLSDKQQTSKSNNIDDVLISNKQQSSALNFTSNTNNTTSLIGLFKNDLEIYMFFIYRPDLINLTLNMIKANGHEFTIVQEKHTKFNILSEKEKLLNKEVINNIKNLNYMTADMKIFAADGRDVLQQLDIKLLLNLK